MRARPQRLERARVEHRGADARDHVRAERLLQVQDRAHRERLSRLEIEQRGDDRGRAEIECDRVAALRGVAGLDVDQQVVDDHGGHLPVGVAEGAPERAQDGERHARLDVVHRREQPLEVGRLVLERRLGQLDVPLLHRRPKDHVPADAGERRLRARLQQRHLDEEVLGGVRTAGEPPAGLQLLRRERARVDSRDRLLAARDAHLALLARAVAAAGRVDRHAVPARSVEQRRPGRDARLLHGAVRLLEDEPDAVGMRVLEHRLGLRDGHAAAAACFFRKRGDPARSPLVVAEQEVGRAHRLDDLLRARIHDRARQAVARRERQERRAERLAAREPERRVRGAAGHVHAELLADQPYRLDEQRDGTRLRADRHRERVDDDVLGRNAVVAGCGDDLLRDFEPPLRLHRDLVVVGEPDHRSAVARDDREDRLEPSVLARDRVDERLALVGAEPRLERLDHRRVDAQRDVGEPLHERDRTAHQLHLVGERVADVDVEHVGAAGDLLRDVGLDAREVAVLQLRLELLASRGVDALADHAERVLPADHDRLRCRVEDGLHQAGTAERRFWIRSLAMRTAVDASAA